MEGAAIIFLLTVCAGVPYLAWKSSKRLGGGPLPMSPKRFYLQTIFAQLYLFALAVVAAWRNDVDLLAAPPAPWRAAVIGAAAFALLAGVMRWRWPSRDRESKDKVYRLLPHEAKDLPLYFAVCVAAGICEETVYRGAATELLRRLTGSLVAAMLIASVAFALAHVVQGWRAAAVIFVIALGAHAVVLLTRSLFPIMIVHALYDAVAGVLMPRWYQRELRSAPQVLSQSTLIR